MILKENRGRAIVWFRKDLRILDNPCLDFALRAGKEIIPVFIWDKNEGGQWSPGATSRWWLRNTLDSLRSSFEELGGKLIFRTGKAEKILPMVVSETNPDSVYFSRVYDPAGLVTQNSVEKALEKKGIAVYSFNASLLNEPWEIKNGTGRPFQVFTPYWKVSRGGIHREPASYKPSDISFANEPIQSQRLEELDLLPNHPWPEKLSEHWNVSEAAGHELIAQTAEVLTRSYSSHRNIPSVEGTSRLSPYLAWGLVSPRQICQAVLQAQRKDNAKGVEDYLAEIGWREFSYHLLYHFPSIPDRPLRPKYANFPWRKDRGALQKWKYGRTGYPLVDAGMHQLYETGWMHNRVRMVVASFLVKHLLLSWSEGAKWFWDTLVDADLASNTQGWQWAAGCGADAAPYFRIFNPILQGEKFDRDGRYVKYWIPSLSNMPSKWIFRPWKADPLLLRKHDIKLGIHYPMPCVDHSRARTRALAALNSLASKD